MTVDDYLVKSLLKCKGITSGSDDNLVPYFKKNYHALVSADALNRLYSDIVCQPSEDFKQRILDKLCYARIMLSGKEKDSVFNYLRDASKEEIAELFATNPHFGIDLVGSYYAAISEDQLTYGKREDAFDAALKFCDDLTVQLLPDVLRNKLRELIFCLFSNSYTIGNALKFITFGIFYAHFVGGKEEFVSRINDLRVYRHYLMKMFYAEIYAAVMGGAFELTPDFAADFTDAVSNEDYSIPKNQEYAGWLLHNYYQLTMKSQDYNLDADDYAYVRKINPLYYK